MSFNEDLSRWYPSIKRRNDGSDHFVKVKDLPETDMSQINKITKGETGFQLEYENGAKMFLPLITDGGITANVTLSNQIVISRVDVLYNLSILTTDCKVEVKIGKRVYSASGDNILPTNRKATITVIPNEKYTFSSLIINGVDVENGFELIISEHLDIVAVATEQLFAFEEGLGYEGITFNTLVEPDFSYLIDGDYRVGKVLFVSFGDETSRIAQILPFFAELENEEKAFALIYMEQDLSGNDPVMNGQVIYTNYLGDEFDVFLGDMNATMPETVGWHLANKTIDFGELMPCMIVHETELHWNGVWVGSLEEGIEPEVVGLTPLVMGESYDGLLFDAEETPDFTGFENNYTPDFSTEIDAVFLAMIGDGGDENRILLLVKKQTTEEKLILFIDEQGNTTPIYATGTATFLLDLIGDIVITEAGWQEFTNPIMLTGDTKEVTLLSDITGWNGVWVGVQENE